MKLTGFAALALYAQSLFSRGSSAKEDLFGENGLVILPANKEQRAKVKQPEYSLKRCDEMKKKSPIDVKFYSSDCDDLKNDYGDFLDVDPKTLKELVAANDKYWCKPEENEEKKCHLHTEGKKKSDYNVKVCAVESFARGRENDAAQSTDLEPKNSFGSQNNPDGSYKDIRISLKKASNVERGSNGVKFEVKKISQNTKSQSSIGEIFTHEVGHSIFGLGHPKSTKLDTIMHAGKREEDLGVYSTKTKKEDKKFINRCLASKSKTPTRDL